MEQARTYLSEQDFVDFFSTWLSGINSEISFWDKYFTDKTYPGGYAQRTEACPAVTLSLLTHWKNTPPLVLDVGSGPISNVGVRTEYGNILLQSCDPLAELYRAMLKKFDFVPYIQPEFCLVEKLGDKYSPETFDFVTMINALDHSIDALTGVWSMLHVLKVGGTLYLKHMENEAEFEQYKGLHQWNVCTDGKNLILQRNLYKFNINEIFKDYADIYLTVEKNHNKNRNVIIAIIKKQKSVPNPPSFTMHIYDKILSNIMMYIFSSKYQEFSVEPYLNPYKNTAAQSPFVLNQIKKTVEILEEANNALLSQMSIENELKSRIQHLEEDISFLLSSKKCGEI